MSEEIPIATVRSIRECELNEFWLQDQIAENPACLQLGELELVSRERQQLGGGRLDMLLTNPEDEKMYEVEVMLGETDESHIVRTIEYWDREKRRWPQRQHFAVLVAESITRRFFNVIHLFSHCIPIVGVQANIVEADGKRVLHFSKVIDTYQEPEVPVSEDVTPHDEKYWQTYSARTLEAANELLEVVRPIYAGVSLNLVKYYIGVKADGYSWMWLEKRIGGKSLVTARLSETLFSDATKLLDGAKLLHTRKNQTLRITVEKQTIKSNAAIFQEIWNLARQSSGT